MAHRKLPADMRYEYPLVVVGGDGWLSVKDLSFITDDQCIKRLGYVPDQKLDALYKSAQVLVIPSLHEGFGLPVLEGFAAQIPVICSATTSLGEISQGAAIHFDPLSVDEIYEALKHVLDDEAVRVKSVSEGRKLLKQYSWDKTARETIRVYDEVL
jgi:alpha-1,3-rhamnosyl/mannosyltransferase